MPALLLIEENAKKNSFSLCRLPTYLYLCSLIDH